MTIDLLNAGIDGFKSGGITASNADDLHVLLNHDPGHREDFPDRLSVVLVREPVQCIASFFKHELKVKPDAMEDTIEVFKQFADQMANFWNTFMCEYAYSSPVEKPVLLFGYDRILANPGGYLRRLANTLPSGVVFDQEKALKAVPVTRRNDHSTFKYYREDPSIVQDIKRITFPIATLLQSRGII